MTKHQVSVCPKCGSTDIGIQWGSMKFIHKCRECHYEFE
ncbi:hypothetical protein [Vibrio phage PJN101]|nr:hypothetical protein [Vibrio phage PJN101]